MDGGVSADASLTDGNNERSGATAPKPRKRVITEARKEQNRTAQRLYRQRQKIRHQALQDRDGDKPRQRPILRPRQTPRKMQADNFSLVNPGATMLPEGPTQRPLDVPGCSSSFPRPCSQPNSAGLDYSSEAPQIRSREDLLPAWPLSGETNNASFLTTGIRPEYDAASRSSIPKNPLTGAGRLWAFPPFPSLLLPGEAGPPLTEDTRIYFPATILDSPRTCTDTEPNQGFAVSGDTSSHSTSPAATDSNASPHLADPYINALQFTRFRTLTAFFYNALSLNFTLRQLLGGSPRNCTLNVCTSPFYRPDATPCSDPRALLDAAVASHPDMPRHLRPTLAQILFPHHAFFDVLPFPSLRSKAITLTAAMPHAFDPMELKKDICIHEAILCRIDGRGDDWSRGEGDRQPWDMRSWEVAPWFLRKWRLLLSQDEGKILNMRETLQNTSGGIH